MGRKIVKQTNRGSRSKPKTKAEIEAEREFQADEAAQYRKPHKGVEQKSPTGKGPSKMEQFLSLYPNRVQDSRTKMTPEAKFACLGIFRIGGSIADACAYIGVSEQVMGEHLRNDTIFREHVDRAVAYGKMRSIRKIRADSDWRAHAWWLERRFGQEWGLKDPSKMTEDQKRQISLKLKQAMMAQLAEKGGTPEEIERICQMIDEAFQTGSANDTVKI